MSPLRALLPLEQKRSILQTGALRIGHGEPAARVHRGPAVRPILRDGVVGEVEARTSTIVEQPSLRRCYHALQRLETRLLRREAATHALYREKRATRLNVRFAATSRARRSHRVDRKSVV